MRFRIGKLPPAKSLGKLFSLELRDSLPIEIAKRKVYLLAMSDEKRLCQNCGKELAGEYCSNCGQRGVEMKLPIQDLLKELIEEVLSFDSRLFHSLIPFITKPGELTVEYVSGKRAHYISPFKLYFFMSFLYFFTAAVVERPEDRVQVQKGISVDSMMTAVPQDSTVTLSKQGAFKITITKDSSGEVGKKFGRRFAAGLRKLSSNPQLFFDELHDHTPQVVFLLLPIFALLLKLVYFRSKSYYIEHLIFSFYFHSFVYFILMAIVLLKSTAWPPVTDYADVLFLTIPLNLFQGMKRVYRQSGGKTFMKFSLLTIAYVCILIAAVAGTLYVLISLL